MSENYDLVYNITWKMWELQGYWRIQKYYSVVTTINKENNLYLVVADNELKTSLKFVEVVSYGIQKETLLDSITFISLILNH